MLREMMTLMINEEAQVAPLDTSRPITISPHEPQVQLMVRKKLIDFLTVPGAIYSVLNTKLTKKSSAAGSVTIVTRQL